MMKPIDPSLEALFDQALSTPEPAPEPAPEPKPRLMQKQKIDDRDLFFLQEYIENGQNAYQAALTAGFSETTALTHATTWIRPAREDSFKPLVWDLFMEHRNKRLTALDVTEDRILREYARAAFFDPRKLFRDDGTLKTVLEMDEDTAMAFKNIDIDEPDNIPRILKRSYGDKLKALDGLATIMGMKKDDSKVVMNFTQIIQEIEGDAAAEPLVVGEGSTDGS